MDKNGKYLNVWGNCEMDFLPIFPSKLQNCYGLFREIKILYPKLATFSKFFGHCHPDKKKCSIVKKLL